MKRIDENIVPSMVFNIFPRTFWNTLVLKWISKASQRRFRPVLWFLANTRITESPRPNGSGNSISQCIRSVCQQTVLRTRGRGVGFLFRYKTSRSALYVNYECLGEGRTNTRTGHVARRHSTSETIPRHQRQWRVLLRARAADVSGHAPPMSRRHSDNGCPP